MGDTVALQPYEEIWLDVHAFEEGVALSSGGSIQPKRVATAIALYRDDFLAGFTLADSPGFDEWQFFRAESLRHSFASALEQLVGVLSDQGDEENAIAYGRRWLALDPLHEPAHRRLDAALRTGRSAGCRAAPVRDLSPNAG